MYLLRLLLISWLYSSQSAAFTIGFALSFNLSKVKTYSTNTKTKTKIKTQTKQPSTKARQPSTKTKTKVQYNVGWSKFMKSYSPFAQSSHIFCLQGLLHGSRRKNSTRLHHSHYLPKVKHYFFPSNFPFLLIFTLAAPWKPYPQLWAMGFPGPPYLPTVVSSLYTSS